ncbi:hypothetical protein V5799_007382 [Amblyomma americanum]|uniref:Uncharacterized protein n=1 Tax=Amblyomma americanum TaxID=6943 RepID=A0AAQ4FG79_AMBAM
MLMFMQYDTFKRARRDRLCGLAVRNSKSVWCAVGNVRYPSSLPYVECGSGALPFLRKLLISEGTWPGSC